MIRWKGNNIPGSEAAKENCAKMRACQAVKPWDYRPRSKRTKELFSKAVKTASICFLLSLPSCAQKTTYRPTLTLTRASSVAVVRAKKLIWNAPLDSMHIAYATVFMGNGHGGWYRMQDTRGQIFVMPTGNYIRDFAVSFTPEPYWPFPETQKTVILNVHL